MYPLQPKDLDDGYERRRLTYNALLREHWHEFADALVEVAATSASATLRHGSQRLLRRRRTPQRDGYGVNGLRAARFSPIVDAASAAGE